MRTEQKKKNDGFTYNITAVIAPFLNHPRISVGPFHAKKYRRKKSSMGRRRSTVTADRASGGLDGGGSASAAGAEGGDSAGDGGVFGDDGEEGECWHELKDEDGSGWSCLLYVYGKGHSDLLLRL